MGDPNELHHVNHESAFFNGDRIIITLRSHYLSNGVIAKTEVFCDAHKKIRFQFFQQPCDNQFLHQSMIMISRFT